MRSSGVKGEVICGLLTSVDAVAGNGDLSRSASCLCSPLVSSEGIFGLCSESFSPCSSRLLENRSVTVACTIKDNGEVACRFSTASFSLQHSSLH